MKEEKNGQTIPDTEEIPASEPIAEHEADGIVEPIEQNYSTEVPTGGTDVVPASGGTPGSEMVNAAPPPAAAPATTAPAVRPISSSSGSRVVDPWK
jgi:hypothetical protein